MKKWKNLFAILFSVFFLSFCFSFSASAVTYSQATVDFYTDQQRNATVNLPWQVNPGRNTFYLNNIYLNDYDYRDSKLAYVSGRVVNEFRPRTTNDFYVCGIDTHYGYPSPTNTKCYGSATIVYENGYTKVVEDLPVYFFSIDSPYSNIIYFDFNTDVQSDWVIDWIQFRFYAQSGYDVVSRNVSWDNTLLFTFWEARSSISAYETPPTGTDVSNELLQQQIGQNQTMIDQNNQTNNLLQQQSQQQQSQYEAEKDEESQREESAQDSQSGTFLGSIGNLIFPFASFFDTIGNQGCFTPTTLNTWLHTTGQSCPIFPASVTTAVSSCALVLSSIIVFGFVIRWLNSKESI